MKRILTAILIFFTYMAIGQGNVTGKIVKANEGLYPPADTTKTKLGWAYLDGWPWWGDGVKWNKNILYFPTYGLPGYSIVAGTDPSTFTDAPPPANVCSNVANVQLSYSGVGLVYNYPGVPFTLNCVVRSLSNGSLTLDPGTAGANQFRNDLVYVDANAPYIHVRKGDNSIGGVASFPEVDEASEIFITYIRIDEANTTPTGVSALNVYQENAGGEFAHVQANITANFAYVTNAQSGTNSIRITGVINGGYMRFNSPSPLSSANYTSVSLWIRNNVVFNANRRWVMRKTLNNVQVPGSSAIVLDLTRGYNATLIGVYQLVVIPLSVLAGSDIFNGIEIRNTGTGGTVDVQFDNIRLESGVVTVINNGSTPQDLQMTLDRGAGLNKINTITQNGFGFSFFGGRLGFGTNVLTYPGTNIGYLADGSNVGGIYANVSNLVIEASNILEYRAHGGMLFSPNYGGSGYMQMDQTGSGGLNFRFTDYNNYLYMQMRLEDSTTFKQVALRPQRSNVTGVLALYDTVRLHVPGESTSTSQALMHDGAGNIIWGEGQFVFYETVAALRAGSTYKTSNYAQTLNYRTRGDNGGAGYYWDPASTATDNGGDIIQPTAILGANPGRWRMFIFNNTVSVKQFGAYGDGVHDDRAAIIAAYDALPRIRIAFNQWTRGKMLFPQQDSAYISSDSIMFQDHIWVYGMNSANGVFQPIKVRFNQDKSGFVFLQGNPSGGSRSPIIENIYVYGAGTWTDSMRNGIRANTSIRILNCGAENFGGRGGIITTESWGNANGFEVNGFFAQGNGLQGLYLTGGETSAGTVDRVMSQFNGRSGIKDNSFLGNQGNGGMAGLSGNGMVTGHTSDCIVLRSGNYYVCKVYNINQDPLTHPELWENVGPVIEVPASVAAWNSGTTYHEVAPLELSGAAQGGKWTGYYAEGGTGGCISKGANEVQAGQGIYSWDGSGLFLGNKDGFFQSTGGFRVKKRTDNDIYASMSPDYGAFRTGDGTLPSGVEAGSVLYTYNKVDSVGGFFPSSGTGVVRLAFAGRDLDGKKVGMTGSHKVLSGSMIVPKFGFDVVDVNASSSISSLGTKDGTQIRWGTTIPINEGLWYGVGALVYNRNLLANDTLAWQCITETQGGNPAHWTAILKAAGGGGGGGLPTGLSYDDATGIFTLQSATFDNNVGGRLRISPDDGTLQIFKSGSVGAVDVYDGGGSNNVHLAYNALYSSTGNIGYTGLLTFAGTAGNTPAWTAASGTPSNTVTPVGWIRIRVNGTDSWFQYFQ